MGNKFSASGLFRIDRELVRAVSHEKRGAPGLRSSRHKSADLPSRTEKSNGLRLALALHALYFIGCCVVIPRSLRRDSNRVCPKNKLRFLGRWGQVLKLTKPCSKPRTARSRVSTEKSHRGAKRGRTAAMSPVILACMSSAQS